MTDIVYRLRMVDPNQVLLMEPPYDTRYLHAGLLCHQAAAEIERLRASNIKLVGAIDMIRETLHGGNVEDLLLIINRALAEGSKP